jgi:hypothetical protein
MFSVAIMNRANRLPPTLRRSDQHQHIIFALEGIAAAGFGIIIAPNKQPGTEKSAARDGTHDHESNDTCSTYAFFCEFEHIWTNVLRYG